MFFFLMKKAFFDGWDNLLTLVITNLIFLFTGIALIWPLFALVKLASPVFFLLLIMIAICGIMLLGLVSALMSTVVDYRQVSWSDVPRLLRKTWKKSLIFGVTAVIFIMISLLGIVYYLGLKNLLGLAASVLLFWILMGAYLITLWYFPARNRLEGGFVKLIKKCVLLMLDNFLLSLYLGLIMIPLFLVLWAMTAFTFFGPSGIQLYLNCALRILLYKYDWLEENPGAKRNRVPWHAILVDEKKRVGTRTIKGMIFPWKE